MPEYYLGLMSDTSVDGIGAALADLSKRRHHGRNFFRHRDIAAVGQGAHVKENPVICPWSLARTKRSYWAQSTRMIPDSTAETG